MPNLTAHIVLFLWPLVGVALFRTQPPERALVWCILGAYLFLPVRPVFDFPFIPSIDKTVIPSVVALIAVLVLRKGWSGSEAIALAEAPAAHRREAGKFSRFSPSQMIAERADPAPRFDKAREGRVEVVREPDRLLSKGWLLAISLTAALGVMITTLTNGDPVPAGPYLLPGMRVYDMVSVLLELGIILIPFFLGWRYLGTPTGQRVLLLAFALGGLLYAPLMLIEVRLSPQLNTWIYGFFPHSFAQHMRAGGFRPVVFLSHGLWVGIFMTMAILSSLALWRLTSTGSRPFDRQRWLILAAGLLVVLVLSKTLGALMIALTMGMVVLFGGRRLLVVAAAAVAALVLLYPLARGAGLVPVDAVLSFAEGISADRAGSFQFRLENEDVLLAKANEKALFGWGTWGRGYIYNDLGNRTSITDGSWIILMTGFGWVGYLAQFGLLCIPLIRLAFRRESGPETAFLAAIVAANLLDLIPNATLESITWLAAGALAGTILPKRRTDRQTARQPDSIRPAPRPSVTVSARRISRP